MIYDVVKTETPDGVGTKVTFTLSNHPDTPSVSYSTHQEASGRDIRVKFAAWSAQFGKVNLL